MYPAGYYVRQIPVQASVIVPAGWKVATALRPSAQAGSRFDYPVTSYEILVDSPLIAGAHYRQIPLSNDVVLDVIADTAGRARRDARADRRAQAAGRAGGEDVRRAALRPLRFPAHHLRTISAATGSSITEAPKTASAAAISPTGTTSCATAICCRTNISTAGTASTAAAADLWTPDYNTVPMEGSLLWVYEGQTQFWGYVLGARSGMLSKQDTLDAIAATAATYSTGTPGRAWRPLVDTTNDPIVAGRAPQPWRSWQRSEDYYSEGQLIWIDVDRIIRQQSGGKRSIDDFARAFFGMRDRDYGELTYTFDDVVATLEPGPALRLARLSAAQGLRRRRRAAARGDQRRRLPAGLHRRADRLDQERARRPARTATSPIRAGWSSATTARSRACCGTAPHSMPA